MFSPGDVRFPTARYPEMPFILHQVSDMFMVTERQIE